MRYVGETAIVATATPVKEELLVSGERMRKRGLLVANSSATIAGGIRNNSEFSKLLRFLILKFR